MNSYKTSFIDFMMESEVLTFGDFTLKSGRKSPYFVNTGKYRTGAQLSKLGEYYAEHIMNTIGEEFDVLFGPAYKGIPLAVSAAAALWSRHGVDRAYCFNRKEAKDHGEGGVFVGARLHAGDRVIIIEDVITAGTAVRETVPILRAAADVRLEHMYISVDRMEKGVGGSTAVHEIKAEFGVTVHPIVTVREIMEHVRGKIDDSLLARMEQYTAEYCI